MPRRYRICMPCNPFNLFLPLAQIPPTPFLVIGDYSIIF
ncbi:hypothetical protein OUS_0268 [Helicobacter pylori R056a]|uniref:Uncharacterized protein n=1 Tax=Helicobacter pylori R018c TaxID=1145110 RepID=K2KW09_HELPX|nr:hypothetical protein OUC_0180 [Helicobacter pylori R018c]EKE96204.1 hypothetical protein OUS_0268 [Helicobacter pylori R056a]